MTPSEFKAWFEGFCEAVGDAPTPEQWAKVQAQIKKMAAPVSVPDLADRYRDYINPRPPKSPWDNPTITWTQPPRIGPALWPYRAATGDPLPNAWMSVGGCEDTTILMQN